MMHLRSFWGVSALLLMACSSDPVPTTKLATTMASPSAGSFPDTSEILHMQATLQEVRDILLLIDEREGFMKDQVRQEEPTEVMDRRILYNMRLLNGLIASGGERINALDRALQQAQHGHAAERAARDSCAAALDRHRASTEALIVQLEQRGHDATQLRQRLSELELQVAMQEALIEARDRDADLQRQAAERIWYAHGNARELREQGVLSRAGAWGLLGRRAVRRGEQAFKEGSMSALRHIPLHGRRATLLTEHPEGSYRFVLSEGRLAALEISDPGAFWSYSRYLVLEER
ncbi:MAG: hypothetical protein R2817_14110 [Flavobacteriales bacterium]